MTVPRSTQPTPAAGAASAEVGFLLRALRTALDLPGGGLSGGGHERLDWDLVLMLAQRHAVRPLLHHALHETVPGLAPPAVTSALREIVLAGLRRNLVSVRALEGVLEEFRRCGIRAVAFKGPVLAARAYGDVGLREYADLDVLVRPADVERARDGLLSLGCLHPPAPAPDRLPAAIRYATDLRFSWPDSSLCVELHWGFAAPYFWMPRGSMDGAWDRLETVTVEGVMVDALSVEDDLLVTCLHGASHVWERLQWVCDVATLLKGGCDLDWEVALTRAREERLERMLALGVTLAQDLLGAPVPEDVSARCRAGSELAALAAPVHAALGKPQAAPLEGMARIRYFARTRDRAGGRLRFLAHRALTPTERDWGRIGLPPALLWMHYPLRLLRIAGRALAAPVRRYAGGRTAG